MTTYFNLVVKSKWKSTDQNLADEYAHSEVVTDVVTDVEIVFLGKHSR